MTASDPDDLDAELRDMYLHLVGDAGLAELFVEFEHELLNPDDCDHGNLGRDGCAVNHLRQIAERLSSRVPATPAGRAEIRAAATGGGQCGCGKPFFTHVCLTCSPDAQTPGPGCSDCRNTGMDQTPCQPAGTLQRPHRR